MKLFATACLLCCLFLSCDQTKYDKKPPVITTHQPVIKLLPLGKIEDKYVQDVLQQLKLRHPSIELLAPEPLPQHAFYAAPNRYRADSIINWLQKRAAKNETYIALTASDISVSKENIKDFGVMGLGFCPGRACVASPYRLKDKNNFYKVAIHELAHTSGLPHCPEKTCYLRDAKGTDPTSEEIAFCTACSKYLKEKGWNL